MKRAHRIACAGMLAWTLAAASFVVHGCGNDNGGPITGGGTDGGTGGDGGTPCTPLGTKFTDVYTSIFSADTCAQEGCHEPQAVARRDSARLDLTGGKDVVYMRLLSDPSTENDAADIPAMRVVPNDLMGSYLWRKVSELNPPGAGSPMPLGCSMRLPQLCLDQCKLDAIKGWILAGAMND